MPEQLTWKPSNSCINLIKSFEGFYEYAYQGKADRPGVITIGFGSIMYKDGSKPKIGDKISRTEALDLLSWEVEQKAKAVSGMVQYSAISQSMFDALVSFAYNLGIGALQSSTLLKKLKRNPLDASIWQFCLQNTVDSCEFLRWVRSNGKVQNGLIRRRKSEATLYGTGRLDFYDN